MNVARRIRWVDGEYEDEVTPDRGVRRQNVVGRCKGGGGFKRPFGAVEWKLAVELYVNPRFGRREGENWAEGPALLAYTASEYV